MTWHAAKWWDKTLNALRMVNISPLSQEFAPDTLADDVTLSASDDYYYYVDMDGFKRAGFQLEILMGVGSSAVVTLEGTLQNDGTARDSCLYQDITDDVLSIPNLSCPADTLTRAIWNDNAEMLAVFKYVRIKVVYTHAANSTVDIFSNRLY